MEAQLQSFRTDLKTSAESGLAITKTDMETYLLIVRKHLMIQSNKSTRFDPNRKFWILGICVCLMISTGSSAWAIRSWMEPNLISLGLRLVETAEATYLMRTADQINWARCLDGEETVDCLKVERS